jgi:DNA-binding LacI/PurR family transcriptional regulator
MATTRLADIAKALDLDISTVSRALRGDPRVQSETRRSVERAAKRLGYRPNVAARALAEGRTRTLWFLIPDFEDPIAREPASRASRHLLEKGYDLLVAQHHDDTEVYGRILERLCHGGADGAIIIPASASDGRGEASLIAADLPFIFLDRRIDGVATSVVTTDNRRAAADIMKSLAKRAVIEGRPIDALINGFHLDRKNPVELARKAGVDEAAEELGIPVMEAGTDLAGFASPCILASSEEDALSLMMPSSAAGRGRIGVFDSWSARAPDLAQVLVGIQDFRAMAELAADFILERLTSPCAANPGSGEVLLPLLEIRESVRP